MQEVIKEEFVFHCVNPEFGPSIERVCGVNCNLHSELFFVTQTHEVRMKKRRTRVVTEVLEEIDVTALYPQYLDMWKEEREAFYAREDKEESFSDVVRKVARRKKEEGTKVWYDPGDIELCDGQ